MAVTDRRDETGAPPQPARTKGWAAHRGWILTGVAVLLVLAGVVLLRQRSYTATAIVRLDPVQLDQLVLPDQDPPPVEDAYAAEIERILGPEITPQVTDQVDGPIEISADPGPDRTLALHARASSPQLAEHGAERLVQTYVANRQQGTAADAVLQGTLDQLRALGVDPPETGTPPPGSPDEEVAQIAALQEQARAQQAALATIRSGATAVVVQEPDVDLGPAHLPLVLIGLGAALGLGALIHAARRRGPAHEALSLRDTGVALHERIRARARHPVSRGALAVVAGLVLARSALYAITGVTWWADDWLIVANLERFGLFGTADGLALSARALPVAWLSYNLAFGVAGDHPLVLFAIGTALNVAVAALLFVVLDRVFSTRAALVATALWILVPNHSSLTAWASTIQARVGLILLLSGVLLVLRGRGWIGAATCLVLAAFSYELTVPLSFASAVLLPTAGTITRRQRAVMAALLAAAALWLRLHPHYPIEFHFRNPIFLWSGHFGAGLVGTVAAPMQLRLLTSAAVAAGAVVCLALWIAGDRRWNGGPALAVSGMALMALGLATINSTAAAMDLAETGSVDRLFTTSSIGAAVLLAGIGLTVYERHRHLAVAGAAALVAVALVGNVHSARTWADAGRTAEQLVGALDDASPDPANTHYIVTPPDPWRRGVVGQTPWTAGAALIDRYGEGDSWVDFDDGREFPPDVVTLDWADIRGAPLPEARERFAPEWRSVREGAQQTSCAVIAVVTAEGC